jgi:predicted amidohydrolase
MLSAGFQRMRAMHVFIVSLNARNLMKENIKAAIFQNTPVYDKQANIRNACECIARAASEGAELISLAEIFYYPYELKGIKRIADTDTRTLDTLRDCAARCGIYVCTGSIAIRNKQGFGNTSFLVSPSGDVLLEYSKTHLFDVDLENMRFEESLFITPGKNVSVAHTDIGTIGICICYDIRFPELVRKLTLSGAEIIIVPAAFNTVTGPAHWNVVFRARAIENQVYVLAASQARIKNAPYEAYGYSMIVDPWGTVCAQAGEDEEIIYAQLDSRRMEQVRRRLPLLSHRRPEIYRE